VDKISIVYDEGISEYDFGEEYALRGDRFPRYLQLLKSEGILDRPDVSLVTPTPATDDDLALVHTREYIQKVNEIAESRGYLSDDTPLKPQLVKAVRLIVGAALRAGDEVAERRVKFSQGVGGGLHHSGRDYGDAWCVFNDVAICAQAMIERYGMDRVLIFDTDAHTGNGTMDIFYENPKVLYLSVHQDPDTIYPHTGYIEQIGKGAGKGYTINVPLPKEANDACMDLILEAVFKPIAKQFNPQVIIRNGGADPHHQDELADLGLTYRGLWSIGHAVAGTARDLGCGVVDLVCGGYNPGVEEWGLYALLSGSMGKPLTFGENDLNPNSDSTIYGKTVDVVSGLREVIKPYWRIEKVEKGVNLDVER
jgi:acetoin utilization protein AcuC